ncbi:MAG: biotin--[acetyl-CoA-carboxylase] ligase [Dissulfurimicrobium sp.]|uniref:biotin--[acetyl-CoA-carboxylase] ligase n=1 Tax=Dissulfurimicrobium sp. TaxID=2022436 RepID=UPI004048EC38
MSRNTVKADSLKRLIDLYCVQDIVTMGHAGDDGGELAMRAKGIVGREVYYLEGARRLMPLAKEAILKADEMGMSYPSGCVWWAENLAGAKGRMERMWWSPAGGVYLCIAIYPAILRRFWSFYSMGVGVAIVQVLREWGAPFIYVRWINDVLARGKKLAGTLTEVITCPNSGENYILFGIGLNINIEAFPAYLPQATSLLALTGRRWPAEALTAHIVSRLGLLFAMLHMWESVALNDIDGESAPNPILKAFGLVTDTIGRRCLYGLDADNSPEFAARALGVAEDGGLILAVEDGEEIKVNTGEIRYLNLTN